MCLSQVTCCKMSAFSEEKTCTTSVELCSLCLSCSCLLLRLKSDSDAIRHLHGFISLCCKLLVIQRPALMRRVWTCHGFSGKDLCSCVGPSLLPWEKELDSPSLGHQMGCPVWPCLQV